MQSHFGRSGFLDDVGKLSDPVENVLRGHEHVRVAGVDGRGRWIDQTGLANPSSFHLWLRNTVYFDCSEHRYIFLDILGEKPYLLYKGETGLDLTRKVNIYIANERNQHKSDWSHKTLHSKCSLAERSKRFSADKERNLSFNNC